MNTKNTINNIKTTVDITRFESMVADIKNLKCNVGDDYASDPILSRVILSSIKNIRHEINKSGISHNSIDSFTKYRMLNLLKDIDDIEKEELSFLKEKGYNIW